MKPLVAAVLLVLALAGPAEALPLGEDVAVSQTPDAVQTDIAYNAGDDQFLVIWVADEAGKKSIFGRVLDGDGDPVGVPRRVFGVRDEIRSPAVAWVPQFQNYIFTWEERTAGHPWEVVKRKMNETLGSGYAVTLQSGEPGGHNPAADAHDPDVDGPFARNLWLVWSWDPLGDDDFQIYRAIWQPSVSGDELEVDQQISEAPVDATDPAIAWGDPDHAEHLMVWEQGGEIWGQLQAEVHGSDGIRRDDFEISDTGGAADPAVAYNAAADEFLVVYSAGGHIRGKRVRPGTGGILVGELDVSRDGGTPAEHPAVAYNPDGQEWLVVWSGTDPSLAAGETEIFGQRIDSLGHLIGGDDVRLSGMGGTGDGAFDARRPAVAYGIGAKTFLTAFDGDDGVDDVFHAFVSRGFAAEEPADPGPIHGVPGTVVNPGGGGGSPAPPTGSATPRSSAGLPGGSTIPLGGGGKAFAVRVACTGPTACAGTLKAVTAKAFASAKRKRVALGRAKFTVPAGTTRKVKVRLTKRGRKLVRARRKLAVRLTVSLAGQKPVRRTVTIRRR